MEVIERFADLSSTGKKRYMCKAKCDCGDVSTYMYQNITRGNTTRCKKCADESRASYRRTHGGSMSRKDIEPEKYKTYSIWAAMKARCNNKNNKRYGDYGGRGITVCERWEGSFESFLEDMGIRPSDDHQIDRVDNDKGYSPKNCRWVTRKENSRNKRNNRILTIKGESKCVAEWAEISGAKPDTVLMRLSRGWSEHDAVFGTRHKRKYNTPMGTFKTLKEVQEVAGMSSNGVHGRFFSEKFPDWYID